MSNGGVPPNQQPRPQVPVRQPVPQIPIEMQRAYDLVNALWNDGEVGAKIRSTAKTRYNIQLPDDAVDARIDPLNKKIADLEKTLADERAERAKKADEEQTNRHRNDIESALNSARQKYNLTQEGFDKMVSRMKETQNFSDAEAAAAWVVSNEPPSPSVGPSWIPKHIDLKGNLDKETVKLLHDDPLAYEEKELTEFMKNPEKYTAETA